ncbi:MAG: DUF1611 domain-containing protein [Flavobacteriaceae bacterium]
MLKPTHKIAIYMDGHINSDYGKMGSGVVRYLPNPLVGVIDRTYAGDQVKDHMPSSKEAPILASLAEAVALGAEVLILGIAPSGGRIPEEWNPVIEEALHAGMSIVNGLHDLISPRWASFIKDPKKQWIWDVRVPQFIPQIASGKAAELSNKRVLFIGTDMAVGKMTAGLELYAHYLKNQTAVGFVATGQIGITITGKGIPLDAFKVDHACGAVEQAVLEQKEKALVLVEGQGSLLHPGSTATLPLMRGSCPTHLILCLRADKAFLRSPDHIRIPDLNKFITLNEQLCTVEGTYPQAKVVAVAANTSTLSDTEAETYIAQLEQQIQLPVTDPVRYGVQKLVDAIGPL